LLHAARAAKAKGDEVLAFAAKDGGALAKEADHTVIVPTDRTDRAQEIHLCVEHLICEIVEREVIG
jgi:D-sedoheptulose 7-phosphate isomerase